jgi:hypothetical protein
MLLFLKQIKMICCLLLIFWMAGLCYHLLCYSLCCWSVKELMYFVCFSLEGVDMFISLSASLGSNCWLLCTSNVSSFLLLLILWIELYYFFDSSKMFTFVSSKLFCYLLPSNITFHMTRALARVDGLVY